MQTERIQNERTQNECTQNECTQNECTQNECTQNAAASKPEDGTRQRSGHADTVAMKTNRTPHRRFVAKPE